jgi:hypothetical protein
MKKLLVYSLSMLMGALGANAQQLDVTPIPSSSVTKMVAMLESKYGTGESFRIKRGVAQTAMLWRSSDGSVADFEQFVADNYEADAAKLDVLFSKVSRAAEILNGYNNRMVMDLKKPLDLDWGPVQPIDEIVGSFNPSAHLTDDLYANKLAFVVSLNFPTYTLAEKTQQGPTWSRKQWAYARMGDMFTSRIPAELKQRSTKISVDAEKYISDYNIFMGSLVDDKGHSLFPAGMKLITHWGLRDELKSNYANKQTGLQKQQLVYAVMKRIIDQSIPKEVINSGKYQWNPVTNVVTDNGKPVTVASEPNTRYQVLLNNFNVTREFDPYYPGKPTFLQSNFEYGMEIPQADVEKLFREYLASPEMRKVGKLIASRLGRKLQPFDIWYDGFKSRSTINEEELSAKTRAKYPTADAFRADMPRILGELGFTPEQQQFIQSRVKVEGSRGSGHAAGTGMKGDFSLLRTRVGSGGMDYKGYNIATHEFGHNVEQTITMELVDYYMLSGVPNNSFTEALAFLFQKRDLELLGIPENNPHKRDLNILDNAWSAYEIMGVSVVDMEVWKWMYAHPTATAAELKEAVIGIAKSVWNQYYADVFGSKDEPILGVYSHMIEIPLYLSAYPIGQLIQFQVEEQVEGKNFASEVNRMYTQGRIIPQLWMKGAVGNEISTAALLHAASKAADSVK